MTEANKSLSQEANKIQLNKALVKIDRLSETQKWHC